MATEVLEGTWEEITRHAKDLVGRKVRVFVLDDETVSTESKIIAKDLPTKDRNLESKWLTENRDKYDGKYVALDGGKLLAVSEKAKEVATKAKELGVDDALIVFVEGSDNSRFISGGVW